MAGKGIVQKFKTDKEIEGLERVLVVEELEPFIEEYEHIFAKEANPKLEIIGKDLLPRNGELNPHLVEEALDKFLNKKSVSPIKDIKNTIQILSIIPCAAAINSPACSSVIFLPLCALTWLMKSFNFSMAASLPPSFNKSIAASSFLIKLFSSR